MVYELDVINFKNVSQSMGCRWNKFKGLWIRNT